MGDRPLPAATMRAMNTGAACPVPIHTPWQWSVPPALLLMLLAMVLSLLPVDGVRAELVLDLYTARLPVADRGNATRAAARREGLRQVLVKASGQSVGLGHSAIQNALGQPQSYLLGYSYEEQDAQITLRLSYDEIAVQRLLREAALPLWTANRPPVLAWLVVSDGSRRRFVSGEELPDAAMTLGEEFQQRGVPLQLPLYDLTDTRILSPGEAWRQSSMAIIGASQRYGDARVLAGRVAILSDGSWLGDWRFLDAGRWVSRSVSVDSFAAFAQSGAALAAETLAGRYAVVGQGEADLRHLIILRGVRNYDDFSAIYAVLNGLESVARVVPEQLLGDRVNLRLDSQAGLAQLARIIELDARFVPSPQLSAEPVLNYEWMP
ncbi:MAG: hypothetical protein ACI87W_000423 [Halieaceae bacterium]|jgi:hypothetical protein